MWAGLLLRFWPYLAGAALLIGGGLWLHHRGYESGYAASEGKWRPLFSAAEKARDAANEMARRKEEDSKALSEQIERQYGETMASLNLRAADADQRLRALSVRLATARSGCSQVPAAAGTPAVPDGAPTGSERAERAGASIAGTGKRCELDAAKVIALQRYVIGLRSIQMDLGSAPDVSQ